MKHVDVDALIAQIVPEPQPPKLMTRKEKLLHWSRIVAEWRNDLMLFHMLEHMPPPDLARVRPIDYGPSAMSIAAMDPTFQSQGLKRTASIADIMGFMEISQHELHEFSCNCGGYISNREQAARIAFLAR